jgi:hypothetical protein
VQFEQARNSDFVHNGELHATVLTTARNSAILVSQQGKPSCGKGADTEQRRHTVERMTCRDFARLTEQQKLQRLEEARREAKEKAAKR